MRRVSVDVKSLKLGYGVVSGYFNGDVNAAESNTAAFFDRVLGHFIVNMILPVTVLTVFSQQSPENFEIFFDYLKEKELLPWLPFVNLMMSGVVGSLEYAGRAWTGNLVGSKKDNLVHSPFATLPRDHALIGCIGLLCLQTMGNYYVQHGIDTPYGSVVNGMLSNPVGASVIQTALLFLIPAVTLSLFALAKTSVYVVGNSGVAKTLSDGVSGARARFTECMRRANEESQPLNAPTPGSSNVV